MESLGPEWAHKAGGDCFCRAKLNEILAVSLCDAMAEGDGLPKQATRETKPVGDELYLLNNTKNPAVMIECGFLSNPEEAQKLENEDYQRQVAFTVLTGISEYRLMQK